MRFEIVEEIEGIGALPSGATDGRANEGGDDPPIVAKSIATVEIGDSSCCSGYYIWKRCSDWSVSRVSDGSVMVEVWISLPDIARSQDAETL